MGSAPRVAVAWLRLAPLTLGFVLLLRCSRGQVLRAWSVGLSCDEFRAATTFTRRATCATHDSITSATMMSFRVRMASSSWKTPIAATRQSQGMSGARILMLLK